MDEITLGHGMDISWSAYQAWMQGKKVLLGSWQEHGPRPAKPMIIPTPRGNRTYAIMFDEYMDWVKVRHASIPMGIVGRRVSIEAGRI